MYLFNLKFSEKIILFLEKGSLLCEQGLRANFIRDRK